MSQALEAEFLSVPEAAMALNVSTSTIWRWIDRGQLAAYRIGQRKVRVKRTDVARMIVPARDGEPGGKIASIEQERERLARPLSKAERVRALAALEAAESLERELAPLSHEQSRTDSSELLNESRDERSQHQA